ncbi:MAG: acyltransferase [Chitinophagales bacterium]|nr:acyltransferase [Chitinophagales bacterium]
MEAQGKPSVKLTYFESFDGIRGVCCLMVLLLHYQFTKFNMPAIIAYVGLHSFFIMSSFLITKTLLADINRTESMWQCFKIYCIKRFTRTFPLYYLYVLIVVVIGVILHLAFKNTFGIFTELKHFGMMLLSFTYNFREIVQFLTTGKYELYTILTPHLWSMAFEEQFYILFFFILFFTPLNILKKIGWVIIIVYPIFRLLSYNYMSTINDDQELITLIIARNTIFQFDVFFYGIVLSLTTLKPSKIWIWLTYISGILLAILMVYNAIINSDVFDVSFFKAIREDKYFYQNYAIVYIDLLVNAFCTFLFAAVSLYPEKFKIFNIKILKQFGILTYSLYIFQFFFIFLGIALAAVVKRYINVYIADLIGLSFALVTLYYFSLFVHKKFELPILLWKNKFVKQFYPKRK